MTLPAMSSWHSFVDENGSDAWGVWELLKGHCKSDDSWQDARTEAGYLDSLYEDGDDDFDVNEDDYIWELLRDDCEAASEEGASLVPEIEAECMSSHMLKESGTVADSEQAVTKLILIEDIMDSDEHVEDLEEAVRELSEAVFDFDCIERGQERDWVITVLAQDGLDGRRRLCGFICYTCSPAPKAELSIKLLAVSQQIKGRGYDTKLMQWFIAKAAHMSLEECRWLTVSAWMSAVPFYERFGFCDFGCGDVEENSDDEEEQVWMELKNCPADALIDAAGVGVNGCAFLSSL